MCLWSEDSPDKKREREVGGDSESSRSTEGGAGKEGNYSGIYVSISRQGVLLKNVI